MTDSNEPVQIEIEDDNEIKDENEIKESDEKKTTVEPKLKIARKKVDELTEQERAQLISDAQKGKEHEFYSVKLFKNGKTRITLKKQSKAQELIQSNETNEDPMGPASAHEKLTTPSKRYLTDNQLLFEHIINLESQYNKLHAKHKKLKKRYNDLEGYLYADDSDNDEKPAHSGEPQQKQIEQPMKQERRSVPASQPNPEVEQPIQQQTYVPQYVQHRYVRSWRDLRPQ